MVRIIPNPTEYIEKSSVCKNPNNIKLAEDKSIESDEGYRLEIDCDEIRVFASSDRGFFYGKMTLKQLILLQGENISCAVIKDEPLYSHRGFMLDCARHMFCVDEIKKLIDLAAMLKFNVFHWHLSDDQGFRIELDSFPELTEKGSVRRGDNFGSMCRSDKPYSGYYKKSEIREIISYCDERFIDVIPELDMPGHTSAILHVFPELSCRKQPVEVKTRQGIYKDNLCIGNSDAIAFSQKLIDELCELFPSKYFHIGGDEAPDDYRKDCPECQRAVKENGISTTAELQCLFANRMAQHLESKGKKAIVWNDILKGKVLDKNIIVQRWLDIRGKALTAADNGSKVIISDFRPYYFDYPYGMYPLKTVYEHNPSANKKLTNAGKANVIGIETPIWTEFINNPDRLEYLIIPRWFAVAETAWSAAQSKNYNEFRSATAKLTEKLKGNGYGGAPERDWDMPIHKRLHDTLKFYKAFLSKK